MLHNLIETVHEVADSQDDEFTPPGREYRARECVTAGDRPAPGAGPAAGALPGQVAEQLQEA